jgi:hypothetical protein
MSTFDSLSSEALISLLGQLEAQRLHAQGQQVQIMGLLQMRGVLQTVPVGGPPPAVSAVPPSPAPASVPATVEASVWERHAPTASLAPLPAALASMPPDMPASLYEGWDK